MADFSSLAAFLTGTVHVPADPEFIPSTSGFNLAIVHEPEAVVMVANADDVAHVVRFAAQNGLAVNVQATGHGAESPFSGGILVNTANLDTLSVDAGAKLATVGAGVRWGAVIAAAADAGLAPISGASPTVGVVGLITGGGLGPLARSHGFSSDYARGFTAVVGTGEIVEATATVNPDLFWALRGGKNNVPAIVTEVRIALVELEQLYAGTLMFEEQHMETVARAWADWTATADPDLTTSIAVMRFPDFEQVPPPLRGRTLMLLRAAYPGDLARGEELTAPLRAFAPVYLGGMGPLAARDVAQIHNDPTEPAPGWASGGLLSTIDQDLITAWLSVVGAGQQLPAVMVEIRHLGSATATDVAEGSAVGGRAAGFTLTFVGAPNAALFAGPVPAAADALLAAVGPWLAPETNKNFVGVGRPGQTGAPWSAATAARLAEVRAAYDPDGVLA